MDIEERVRFLEESIKKVNLNLMAVQKALELISTAVVLAKQEVITNEEKPHNN